jgi:hypothetical protein
MVFFDVALAIDAPGTSSDPAHQDVLDRTSLDDVLA